MNLLANCLGSGPRSPLILYELNEVPWRVFDWYVAHQPGSAFTKLARSATTFTTVTQDEGELHPWTTWPSLHRGVYNTKHNVRFINQDLAGADQYPPVWEVVKNSGKSVGVFGSLQSYSGLQPDYSFYIPDTFAPGVETWPKKYSAFQRFNLRQTQQDGAEASAIRVNKSVAVDVAEMLQIGLSFRTLGTLATHLANERLNGLYRSRRSVLQGLVAFDIFKHALNECQPDFCTFFTNHVAGMMHRYWKYTFPEDFDFVLSHPSERFHAENIRFAMDVADAQLSYLMRYVDSLGGMLIVASSMGQEAINRGEYSGEWRLNDAGKLLSVLEWKSPVKTLMAMQPDFNFSFDSEIDATRFLKIAECIVDDDNISVWQKTRQIGPTLNLQLSPSRAAVLAGEVTLALAPGTRRKVKIGDIGIQFLNRDPGTGYHQPQGILCFYGAGIGHDDSRSKIELTEVRPALLELTGTLH
jgi:hypothetical protein